MGKTDRRILFLLSLAGGVVYAGLFLVISGCAYGFSRGLVLITLGGGLAFALLFFAVWMLTEKFQKPFTLDNPKAQRKLSEYETSQNRIYESKFAGFLQVGKGLREAVCESCVYLESDRFYITYCYFGKVRHFEIAYSSVQNAEMRGNLLLIQPQEGDCCAVSIKGDSSQLLHALMEKGLYHAANSLTCGKLFFTKEECVGTAYLELQYGEDESTAREFSSPEAFWHADSLYIHADDMETFFEKFGFCFALSAGGEPDWFGITFFDVAQTREVYDKIRASAVPDSETLLRWLEKAVAQKHPIYLLGL